MMRYLILVSVLGGCVTAREYCVRYHEPRTVEFNQCVAERHARAQTIARGVGQMVGSERREKQETVCKRDGFNRDKVVCTH